jgi:hypothetical protein
LISNSLGLVCRLARLIVAAGWIACGGASAQQAPRLAAVPALDKTKVTVSGISSGGYFAHQFHLAYSGLVNGAGIVAGGPYACAEQVPLTAPYLPPAFIALTVCSHKGRRWYHWGWLPDAPDARRSEDAVRDAFAAAEVDDPANLADDRVWLFSGGADDTVPPGTVSALKGLYQRLGIAPASLGFEARPDANHGMPIEQPADGPVPACGVAAAPYLIDCDFDAAEKLLRHLYPAGIQPAPGVAARELLLRFDQSEFFGRDNIAASLAQAGFLYVPAGCAAPAGAGTCRLHVAFHGCQQNPEHIGQAFAWGGGYNRWAEANRIVVLYPQTANWPSFNPLGCWDFWGYTGAGYLGRDAKQMRAVKAMIDRLLGR